MNAALPDTLTTDPAERGQRQSEVVVSPRPQQDALAAQPGRRTEAHAEVVKTVSTPV